MRTYFTALSILLGLSIFAQNDGVDCTIPTTELDINGANDIKATILVEGSTASSYQTGENIEKSFDGDLTTLYHSSWSNTEFPVVLNYRLDGNTPIDYLRYIPRTDGATNGDFGNVSISYNTNGNSTYQDLMDFDFEQSGMPVNVHFPYQITPLNIKITVYDGAGNFASCAEMEFYTLGDPEDSTPIPGIFADELCSSLNPGVTQSQIDAISSPFYKSLAQCLFDGNYTHRYRVQDYEVYPTVASTRNMLKVGVYNQFENPTGILFESNEKIALFAKDIPNSTVVYLAIKDFESSFDGPVAYYELKNGLNVFETTHRGLGYISYFNDDSNLADVSINIVSGKINGYFDRFTSDNSEFSELINKTTYSHFDLIGECVHLVYEREAFQTHNPTEGTRLLEKYDTIVMHQRLQMGLYKYDKSPKNRMLTYSERGGGYWAGGLGVHLDLTWGENNVVHPDKLDIWGIPHEYGHINQIRPDLLWIGTTEVTNNIYSVWANYHLNNEGVNYSRLEAENTTPIQGVPAIQGGRMNGALYNTVVQEGALQGTENYDVFEVLVPFWQLQLYYQLAGALRNAPILDFDYPEDYDGVDYAHWYGTVAEMVRNNNHGGLTNGEYLLNFVKNTCDAVEEDLIDFFIQTGFLRPIDRMIDDYGMGHLQITQEQIDATIAEIQAKNYQSPVSPVIHYMSAHSLQAYKDQLPLSGETGVGVEIIGPYLRVNHSEWKNAVAYETYNADSELIYVSIAGSGDLSNQTTRVYYPTDALRVYAVGYDGHRSLVYPADLSTTENELITDIKIYPNPLSQTDQLHIQSKNNALNYKAELWNRNAQMIWSGNGNLNSIEQALNRRLNAQNSGVYILNLTDENGKTFNTKLIKK